MPTRKRQPLQASNKFRRFCFVRSDEAAARHSISSLSPSYRRSCRCLLGLLLVVATDPDNFCNRAVRGAEFQCAPTGFGDDGSAVRLDLGNVTVTILHFDPPMVDAQTGTGKLRLLDIFAVVYHQGEIDVSVCQVSRDMPARISCADLAKVEHLFIKLASLLQIVDFDGDVNDARHAFPSL